MNPSGLAADGSATVLISPALPGSPSPDPPSPGSSSPNSPSESSAPVSPGPGEDEDWSWMTENRSQPDYEGSEREESESTQWPTESSWVWDDPSKPDDLHMPELPVTHLETFPQFQKLPNEIKTMIFEEAVRDFSTEPLTKLTHVWGVLHRDPKNPDGPDKTPVTANVYMYRRRHVHDLLRNLTQLCHETRRAMIGRPAVLFYPSMDIKPNGTSNNGTIPRRPPLPVLDGATREIVLLPIMELVGFAATFSLKLDGAMICDAMVAIFGNKVQRIHLVDMSFPRLSKPKINIPVAETGRTYQIQHPSWRSFCTTLYETINAHFPHLPNPGLSAAQTRDLLQNIGLFADSDAKVFDITSGDREYENHKQYYGRNITPTAHFGEIMRFYRDDRRLMINAGIRGELRDKCRYPDVRSVDRLCQVVQIAATKFPDLEYVSVLSRLALEPRGKGKKEEA